MSNVPARARATRRRPVPAAAARLLAVLVLALAPTVALAACGSGEEAAGARTSTSSSALPSGGTPVAGGTLTYATDQEPDLLDPEVSGTDITALVVRNVVDSLVGQAPDGTIVPWLAQSWKVSADGLAYTFRLRDGISFTDGAPLDAAAVKVNFDRVLGPKETPQGAGSLVEPVEAVRVVDPQTVAFTLKRPYGPFLVGLSNAHLGLVSPRQIAHDSDAIATRPIGSGPYSVASWAKGSDLVLRRNPAYAWPPRGAANDGAAHLDEIRFRFLPEASVRVGTLTSGQANVALAIPPVSLPAVERDPRLVVSRYDDPGANYLLFLNTAAPPTDDLRVRQALLHAIDVEAIVRSLYKGQFARPLSILSPTSLGYAPTPALVRHDPQLSARLLDAAGWSERDAQGYRTKDGRRLTIEWLTVAEFQARDERTTYQQLVQAAAKRAGIELDVKPTPNTQIAPPMVEGRYGALDFSNKAPDPDVLYDLFESSRVLTAGGANMVKLDDPQLDAWLREGRETTDRARRAAVYAKVQQRVLEQAAVVPLYVHPSIVGIDRRVRGLTWSADGYLTLQGAWLAPQ